MLTKTSKNYENFFDLKNVKNKNMQPKLSIIVPIYNVEQYLRKCVESLIKQDYASYELILVDDGSTDGSSDICDEYARANDEMSRANALNEPLPLNDGKPQIRVIHQKNGGLSAARNSGIVVAQGEYLMFVDSDDYIEPNVLGRLMKQVERDDLDVLRYRLQYVRVTSEGMNELTNEWEYEVYNPYKSNPFKGNDYSEEPTDGVTFLNERMNTACYAWQFLIKRSLIIGDRKLEIGDCLFTPGIYFEDVDWTPRMLVRAKRVASTETVVYNYLLTRTGSITNAVNRSKQKKVLDDKMRLVGEMQRQSNELEKKGLSNAWFSRMIADNVVGIIGILSSDFYKERRDYLEKLEHLNVYPLQSKIMKARLINFSPKLAVALLHLKNS